jgi:hypothetical protein
MRETLFSLLFFWSDWHPQTHDTLVLLGEVAKPATRGGESPCAYNHVCWWFTVWLGLEASWAGSWTWRCNRWEEGTRKRKKGMSVNEVHTHQCNMKDGWWVVRKQFPSPS